jgi:hypothetical protein
MVEKRPLTAGLYSPVLRGRGWLNLICILGKLGDACGDTFGAAR